MLSIGPIEATVDITAEQSVLGAVFLEPEILDELTFLESRDFYSPRHQKIFEVMRYLHERGMAVDVVTVAEEYLKFGRMDDMGGVTYLTELVQACPTAANAVHHARIVRSKAIRRRGVETAQKIAELAHEDFESDEDYFSAVEALVSDMRPQEVGKMRSFRETREQYFRHLTKKAEFIPTGFKQFDDWAHGLWRGWLFVSAGRPSVGKTALVLQRLLGIARQNAGVVLLYSQEMDENQIKDRMIACASGVNYSRIKNKNLTDNELAMIRHYYDEFEALPIFIQDSSGVSIDEIRATARLFKRRYGKIACIAVDYLQIMSIPQKRGETRAQAIGRVTSAAKQIARDMDCCFMMLSQMTRESEQKKKPQLSDLRESGAIEQDADVVEFLWHDPNDSDPNGKVIQQTIAKGRDIGVNEFRLLFQGWLQRFKELPLR
ncbi:MAG: DNA helicase [Bacillus thermozeamaize]|uniref:DNA 5'-3' helicase n=1 Tax=Bacillus thermozeamaize TaxID=230954 RepID=A0A1Y3PHN6_9BACI|nr:MAG: DNA helicase [Bacillus thermozeamaize]